MHRSEFLRTVSATALALSAGSRALAQEPPFALGDDVLLRDHLGELAGRHIGIITNQSGVTSDHVSIVDALVRTTSVDVHALFGPEHGLRGDHSAGAYVPSYRDERTGLPVYSLYGPTRHPSKAMLSGIDVLLFDIQDVGARMYTFISTMAYAMQSAAEFGIEFWVLDRPNPVGGEIVEGPVLDPRFSSFIGLYPIAMRHGMTVGELAQLFNVHFGIGAKLRVIKMDGWRRSTIWPQTHLEWVRTSPNIPTWLTCFVYLCTGLVDDMGLNNGVGTLTPFFFAGAERLDADEFAQRMDALALPGITFDATQWTPQEGYNAGKTFSGVRLNVLDPARVLPVHAAVQLLATARDMQPGIVQVRDDRAVDIDWGTDRVRAQLLADAGAPTITDSWARGVDAFMPLRERFLLYS
jgi:uncharacterized protein YbbC (DUF1343 family)